MPELFEVHTPPDAWRMFTKLFRPVVRTERIAVTDALNRVLAENLVAPHDLPSFARSTVDGYAVAARDSYGASAGMPAYFDVAGEVPMGKAATISLDEGHCALVHTGGMIPADADAVVMVEHTQQIGDAQIEVFRPVAVGQNVIQIGEDVRRGEPVLPAGHLIRPQDIGGLLALGITQIDVAAQPRVAILSQGDEVVPPDQEPAAGQIRDINSYTLAALTYQAGGAPIMYPIVPDRLEALQTAAAAALAETDMLVMSAGSSVSFRDMTAQVIQGLGEPGILVHGVSVKPGKPTILALCGGKPVFGLPGNPVSAMVIFDLFVAPTIRLLLGAPPPEKTTVRARLARNIASTTGREDFVQVRLEDRAGEPWAVPVFGKSNLIYTLIRSEGVLHIPLDSNGIAQGEWVTVDSNTLNPKTPYLHDISLDQAVTAWHAALEEADALGTLSSESLPVVDCLGRVTAAPVWARISLPHYHASAMDGYAVRAEDTAGATETTPKRLVIGEQAFYVDTGDPLPPDTNSVIMVEDVQVVSGDPPASASSSIEIMAATVPWHYVRPMGEDIVATQLVLPSNHLLRPQDLGAAVGCGHTHLAVRCRPRVAIIPTGTELVSLFSRGGPDDLKPGDIIETNSIVLGAMAEEWGCVVNRFAPVPDNFEQIRAAVVSALSDHDLVVINAGSSAGSEDFTASVVDSLGQVVVHGIAIRPGHPVILGVAAGKPIVGIPGYPGSAAMTFDLLVKPVLFQLQGRLPAERPTVQAFLTQKVYSPMGEDEFLRVLVGQVGERLVATPLQRGAGVIMSLVRADGIVRLPRFSEGEHAGASVTVELLRPPEALRNTLVCIGSHDMTLDVLADQLRRARPEMTLASSNVGSYGGLLALQRHEAHFAGSHLLDDETGEYNVKVIKELGLGRETGVNKGVVLLRFVGRVQGLIVPAGNPKHIASLADLTRSDVSFINRQRGAGTRVLLDYKLAQLGIRGRQVRGYERQEYTHLAVAAAVRSGTADCGLGILAAARALGLDFVPLFNEQYDLVIPSEYYTSELFAPLLAVIRSEEFAATVEALGGYDTQGIGQVISEL